ncbi:hypothetical protein ACJX0J_006841, partial [Zea mays]
GKTSTIQHIMFSQGRRKHNIRRNCTLLESTLSLSVGDGYQRILRYLKRTTVVLIHFHGQNMYFNLNLENYMYIIVLYRLSA